MCAVGILIRVVLNAIAVWVATLLVGGVDVTTDSTGRKVLTLVVVGAVLAEQNLNDPVKRQPVVGAVPA